VHFGLGDSGSVEKIMIRWPSGKTQTLTDLEINKLHFVKED
jgi:hypothetical protein